MLIDRLKSTASTLDNLVTFLTKERSKGNDAIKDILLSSHPVPYRVVFHSFLELDALLTQRGYVQDAPDGPFTEWVNKKAGKGIRVADSIFEEGGKLKIITPEEWDPSSVTTYDLAPPDTDAEPPLRVQRAVSASKLPDDDDVPF